MPRAGHSAPGEARLIGARESTDALRPTQSEPARRRPADLSLARACVAGDPHAWRRFDSRYRPLVLRLARQAAARMEAMDPATTAEDAAAEVFADLLANDRRTLARYQGRSSLATWLGVLTRRRTGKLLKQQRPALPLPVEGVEGGEPAPDDQALAEERRRLVRQHLLELRPRDRLALQLFYESGHSYKEVGRLLMLSPTRVGTLLARARQRLGRALA